MKLLVVVMRKRNDVSIRRTVQRRDSDVRNLGKEKGGVAAGARLRVRVRGRMRLLTFSAKTWSPNTHEKQFVCCCCYRFVNEGSVCARATGASQRSRSRCSFDLLAFVRSSRARWRRACAERKEVGSVTSHSLRRVPSKRRCSRAHLALNRDRCTAPCELCSTQPDREEALVAKCQL